MRLRAVTASGVDDKVPPELLLEVQEQYPFVEWGILLSASRGKPRYPTAAWIADLHAAAKQEVRLSGHLCGKWAKDVCRRSFPSDIDTSAFRRFQLNIAPYLDLIGDVAAVAACLPPRLEYILQVGANVETGLALARRFADAGVMVSVLFDASGGHGITPAQWPDLPDDVPCGFAGGLGPDNLEEQLGRLAVIAGEQEIWIDMESKLRSDADEFDLGRIRQCLESARGYVS